MYRFFLMVLGIFPIMGNPSLSLAQHSTPPAITAITPGGVGFVTHQVGPNGLDALVGRWDTVYPGGKDGPRIPGLEPDGASTITLDIDVNDGGNVSFDYYFETYDQGIYDWLDITLVTPAGPVKLASHIGNPAGDYGSYWVGPRTTVVKSLIPYVHQHVKLIISVQQDGWGDQSAAQISSLDFRSCPVPPLNPLPDDPLTQSLENGNIDTEDMVPGLQAALLDFKARVGNAGGNVSVTCGFRTPAYQSHLREVYDKYHLLQMAKANTSCSDLKMAVAAEFFHHGLGASSKEPASPSGTHTQGLAFDARVNGLTTAQVDALAKSSGLVRPFPQADPVHFQLIAR